MWNSCRVEWTDRVRSWRGHRAFQSADQIALRVPDYCASDYMTLVTASDAFLALNGVYPIGLSELVDAGLLYKAGDEFNLTNTGSAYVLTGVGGCSGFEPG